MLGQTEIPEQLADPSIVDRVFEAGPFAVVGVAFALVLYLLGKKFLEIWGNKGTLGQLEQDHPDKSPQDLVQGYATVHTNIDRVHGRIDNTNKEVTNQGKEIAALGADLKATTERLDRMQ